MGEMNIPGIETARMKVAQLSKNPINNGRTKLPDRIVRALNTAFALVDLEYEKKTGEPALPTSTANKVRFKKRN